MFFIVGKKIKLIYKLAVEISYQFLNVHKVGYCYQVKKLAVNHFFQMKICKYLSTKNTKIKQPYLALITGCFVHLCFLVTPVIEKVGI